jgi:ceramide glucosyltransferase
MYFFIDIFFIVALILSGSYFAFLLFIAFLSFRKQQEVSHYFLQAPISIFKPLSGIDDQLEINLRSFFQLDYPEYELLFGVNQDDDPVIPVIKKLQEEFPNISAQLIINTSRIGLNPKINNLFNIYPFAQYDFMLISDSNVRVSPDYLQDLMKQIQLPNTGLVTSTIRGKAAGTLGSLFENMHLNSFIAPSVYAIRKLINLPITIGKSMFFRRDTIEKIGGFWAFRNVLAEDHLMGSAITELGMEVRTSSHAIDNINERWKISNFYHRHLRWAKLRKNISELYYLIEVLSNPIPISLLYALIRMDQIGFLILFLTILLKITIDISISRYLRADISWYQFLLIPLKDFIIGYIWFIPHFSKKVVWRGNSFKITKNTQLVPILKG